VLLGKLKLRLQIVILLPVVHPRITLAYLCCIIGKFVSVYICLSIYIHIITLDYSDIYCLIFNQNSSHCLTFSLGEWSNAPALSNAFFLYSPYYIVNYWIPHLVVVAISANNDVQWFIR
jgi:hypothetical protein